MFSLNSYLAFILQTQRRILTLSIYKIRPLHMDNIEQIRNYKTQSKQ